MKKIITALGNPNLNEELKKIQEYKILGPDIQYQEGILEKLERNKDIDFLILSEIIPGEINIIELISKIKEINEKIEIIIILEEEKEELKNRLIEKGVFNIFYNYKITKEEIIKIINKKEINSKDEIKEEIELLKKMLLEKNKKKTKNKKFKKIKNKIISQKTKNKENYKKENKIKIISVTGANGVGKTMISYMLACQIKNKKILLIDFSKESHLNILFGIKKYLNKKIDETKIENMIIKINKKIHLICTEEIKDEEKIKEILKKIKEKYDVIICDLNSSCKEIILKKILINSDKIVFIAEANLLGIKKSQEILKKYIYFWKIKKEKIEIIFNKQNKNSIDRKILNKIFSTFYILGKINYNLNYNLFINKKINFIDKKSKKEYEKIIKNIFCEKIRLFKMKEKIFIKNNK